MSSLSHLVSGALYLYHHVPGVPVPLVWSDKTMVTLIRKMKDGDNLLVIGVEHSVKGDGSWLPGVGITVATMGHLGWIYIGTSTSLTRKRFVRL